MKKVLHDVANKDPQSLPTTRTPMTRSMLEQDRARRDAGGSFDLCNYKVNHSGFIILASVSFTRHQSIPGFWGRSSQR